MTTNAQNSKQFLGQQGSATVPSFSFLGYNTTGVYLPAANKISITTNGTQALTVDASQNVGIGTSSPGYKLDVAGSIQLTNASPLRWKNASGTSRGILMLYSDNNVYLDADDGGQIFRTGGYERMRIDSSGNVGIGVTPSAWGGSYKALQVSAGSLASYTTIASSFGQNYYDSGAGSYKYINSDYASRIRLQSGVISFEVVASGTAGNAITFNQAMTLDNSGNLGIGTASPSYKLDAFAGTTNSAVAQFTGNNSGRGLKLSTAQTTFADDTVVLDAQMSTYGTLAFKTGGTERMRIDSSGNVGIGISSPSAKLDVSTSINLGQSYYNVGYDLGGGAGWLGGYNVTYSGGAVKNVATGALSSTAYTGNGIQFFTNTSAAAGTTASERMRITSAGNVGIGTSSPTQLLDVRGSIYVERNSNPTNGVVISATNQTTSSNNGCKLSLDAYNIGMAGLGVPTDSASLAFYTNGVTSERMRIDSSGNVGIGTSSPGVPLNVATPASGTGVIFGYTSGTNNPRLWFSTNESASTSDINATGSTGNNNLTFSTSNNERARIDSSGNLRVNNTAAIPVQQPSGNINCSNDISTGSFLIGVNNSFLGRQSSDGSTILNTGQSNIIFSRGNYGSTTESARIDSSGNLLVGTTNSGAGTGGPGAKLISTGQVYSITSGTTDSYNYYSDGVGYRFYVTSAGTIYATNTTISAISDQRLKENVRDLDVGLDAIMALKPRKFDWKEGRGKDIKNDRGFIAQEFEQVFPDLIDEWKDPAPEGEEPYKAVRADLIPVLVKAIQELSAKVAALEGKA